MASLLFTNFNQFIIDLCETVTQYKLQTVPQPYRSQVVSQSIQAFLKFAQDFFEINYPEDFANNFKEDLKKHGLNAVLGMYKYQYPLAYVYQIFKSQIYKFYYQT